MDRGIIASPGIIRPLPQGFIMERSISREELRYYLMYWDRVVIPGNNLVYIGIPEEEAMISAGAIERPRLTFQGSFQGDQIAYAILSCQALAAKELVRDKSIDWVIHQFGDECVLPAEYSLQKNTIRVDLASALPVPSPDTPVEEILEFKTKRKDELRELHEELDRLYEEVLLAPDQDLASRKAVADLARLLDNLDKLTRERFEQTRRFDLSVELNLSGKDIFVGASAGALIDFYAIGLTVPLATIVGALASTIRITSKWTKSFEPAKENSKLAYLTSAKKVGLVNGAS